MAGNYLSYNGQIIKVENITNKKVGYHAKDNECRMHYARLHECKPVPLTPEILEKNGFVLKPDGWLWCKEEGIEDKNYIFIQFRKGCDEVRLVELNFVNKVLAKYEQIHYAHELQHALRLCGIEKEIIL